MGTCILLERLWIDRNKHRLANKSEVCRALWYPSLSYARRSIVLRLPVQENPVVRVTPTDSLWISAKPWNEQIKSSIFSAWKCKTKSQVQTNTMPVLSKRFKLNGVAPRAKSKLWRHAQLALKLIPASKDSHEDRITWKLVDGTNHQWFCFDLNTIFAASCGRPWFVFVGQCAQLWPYPHFHCHRPCHRCPNTGQIEGARRSWLSCTWAYMSMNASWHSLSFPSPWPLELEVVLTYPNWVAVRCARSSSTKPLKEWHFCAFWTQQTPLNKSFGSSFASSCDLWCNST